MATLMSDLTQYILKKIKLSKLKSVDYKLNVGYISLHPGLELRTMELFSFSLPRWYRHFYSDWNGIVENLSTGYVQSLCKDSV